jgi:nucleoside-diphosphate-sugar epimerase
VKVLVAGGAGFIGSHLCARLLADGHEVICADNLITGSEANIRPLLANPRFHLERVDVSRPCPFDADAIFHLASPASPVGYMEHPFETIHANSNGTFELLQAARRTGGRFLMASTSEAYGDPLVHPQVETYFGNVNPTGPRACYDESKRLGETITAEFHRQYGVDARIVRIFNTYGPHSQLHDGRMVPNFIVQAVQGEPLTIHGQGQQTRSICYVDDLVEGLLAAMFTPDTAGEIFNLGNPEEHTVLDWARMIIQLCESDSTIIFEEKRQDDPERRRPDITKARQRLKWSPRIGPDEGLRRTVEWFRGEIEREHSPAPLGAQ